MLLFVGYWLPALLSCLTLTVDRESGKNKEFMKPRIRPDYQDTDMGAVCASQLKMQVKSFYLRNIFKHK